MLNRKLVVLAFAIVAVSAMNAGDVLAFGPRRNRARSVATVVRIPDPIPVTRLDVTHRIELVPVPVIPIVANQAIMATNHVVGGLHRVPNPVVPIPETVSSPLNPLQSTIVVFPNGSRVSRQRDGNWIEVGKDGHFVGRFSELHQDSRDIVLREESQRFILIIPKAGGQIMRQFDGEDRAPWGEVRFE